MTFNFSIPIKTYSKYEGTIVVPFGFNTPSIQLDNQKWRHFNRNYQITFNLQIIQKNIISIKTMMGETTVLDDITITIGDQNDHIRCSSRCPSLSCKYLKQENGIQVLKRFQLEFNNSIEFTSVKKSLQAITINIKEYHPTGTQPIFNNNNNNNNNNNSFSQYHVDNPSTTQLSGTRNTICNNDYARNDSLMDPDPSLINSQIEAPIFYKNNADGIRNKGLTNVSSLVQNKLPSIDFLIQHTTEPIMDLMTPLNNNLSLKENDVSEKKLCYSQIGTRTDCRTTSNSQHFNSILHHDKNVPQISKSQLPTNHNLSIPDKNSSDVIISPIKGMSHASLENVDSHTVLPSNSQKLEILQDVQTIKVTSPLEISEDTKTTTIQETENSECNYTIPKPNSEMKNVLHSSKKSRKKRIKISKKVIKEKLNDKKFMKWVCFPSVSKF
ncbi:similar to Saccharomyces cerevisiae YMR133W REC114 Protein involved in early stages of meiotic recombination [Maudiozyma barnettii]|uniref:Similar to Saccharomyces cerevisiae YMR133W REC114 Protein involved in early stages of meiotic recombination n=1 Tax=Maudiozyma barnettii TaxID=61262 RepID=A0A8H2ZJQ5_9SACH|nr:Rec114p [Kazachstania barnettii]CAB4254467.1 similar to Saccharomyces cerevisiae YMR133W REC114 Protein involved in early stages of meiotic recombination [Kazachstania barnettii]CAD1782445.1 similar to Saccharomyces cerevisiae YMR133W REC114 Protein involved in early stages of meiotic recombination [Kazachstania barnettii]